MGLNNLIIAMSGSHNTGGNSHACGDSNELMSSC